jgi:hypothetical protein
MADVMHMWVPEHIRSGNGVEIRTYFKSDH